MKGFRKQYRFLKYREKGLRTDRLCGGLMSRNQISVIRTFDLRSLKDRKRWRKFAKSS